MAFTIEKPIVLTDKQFFHFKEIMIMTGQNGLEAYLSFFIKNENGEILQTITQHYAGQEFNTFWASFNSGTFLYQELARIKDEPAPENGSLESEFLNP